MKAFRPTALALLVAGALAFGASVSPAGAAETPLVRTVAVSATATVSVPNDSARLGLSVMKERSSRGAALRATSTRLRSVIAAVKKVAGVGAGDVRTGRISVREVSRGARPVYRAVQGIGVVLHEPGNAGRLALRAIGAGATGVSGPTFFVGDAEAARAKALGAAFDKAKAKARALAARAEGSLGQVLEVDEGEGASFLSGSGSSGGGYSEESASSKGAAAPPTRPGTSKVRATVHVVFELL